MDVALFIGLINKSERKIGVTPFAKQKTDSLEKEEKLVSPAHVAMNGLINISEHRVDQIMVK